MPAVCRLCEIRHFLCRSHAVMAKKCTKMHDTSAELLFYQSKPIVFFLPFLLTSPSLFLKLLNLKVESVVAVTCFYCCMHNVQ